MKKNTDQAPVQRSELLYHAMVIAGNFHFQKRGEIFRSNRSIKYIVFIKIIIQVDWKIVR
jgi:hypothetical protein